MKKQILYLILFIILCFIFSGCDKIKNCRPDFDIKTGEIGFVCKGEW